MLPSKVQSPAAPAAGTAPKVAESKSPAGAAAAAPKAPEPVVEQSRKHSEEYYDVKTTVFNALIDTIDLTQLAKLEVGGGSRGDPRHRQRDHPDQERRDVDRRAGGAARGHL